MPRLLSTLLVIGLLVGTATAFAVTERLKLVPSPIITPEVTPAFSPTCECETEAARIEFGLRDADRIDVAVVNAAGEVVDTLVTDEDRPSGRTSYEWDGVGADEGVYRVRVHLARARRTIDIPNEMRLDTTPPELTVESILPRVFSPDGDGDADKVSARFGVSEESRVRLLVDGERAVETPPRASDGKIDWYARGVRAGPHDLRLVGADLAGNLSDPSVVTTVRLRFVELRPARIVVPARARFGVRVSTDADRYRWRIGARTGSSSAPLLILRAPQRAGRYTLRVSYGEHRAAIPVFVRARP